MLKGDTDNLDLYKEKTQLLATCEKELKDVEHQFGLQAINILNGVEQVTINYPVARYPDKISSFNLDKDAEISGTLAGIKGQYLIFDTGVINLRRFSGYQVSLSENS